jgi:hypothetical protein
MVTTSGYVSRVSGSPGLMVVDMHHRSLNRILQPEPRVPARQIVQALTRRVATRAPQHPHVLSVDHPDVNECRFAGTAHDHDLCHNVTGPSPQQRAWPCRDPP